MANKHATNMKIDLHLHSPLSAKNGDSIHWISNFDTLKTLKNNSIQLCAFTDHNDFSLEQYKQLRDLGKTGGVVVLPGIEVDVKRKNDSIGHLLVVFREDLNDDQLQVIESIARKDLKKTRGISIEKANVIFSSFETIKIPHVGKGDYFITEDLEELQYDAIEISNHNHPNYTRWKKRNIEKSVVSFSDTHIWKDYPQQSLLITDVPNGDKTFSHLKTILAENKDYTKERI